MSNEDLESSLELLPDKVADVLLEWRKATLEREKTEALLFVEFKANEEEKSSTEIKALINSSPERYAKVMEEIKAEVEYNRWYEKLLSVKKRASLRTSY